MDQGLAIFLAAVIAAAGTVVGVLIGGRISAKSAEAAAKIGADATREAALAAQREASADRDAAASAREEAREDARLARFVDNKRELLTTFWIACDRHNREVEAQVQWRRDAAAGRGGDDPGIGPTEPARQAFLALTLVANVVVVGYAESLLAATTSLGSNQADEVDEPAWVRDLSLWMEAAADFENAAGADLRGEFVPTFDEPG